MARVLIAGCGDLGAALARLLLEDGHQVWGLRRNADLLPTAIKPLRADLSRLETLLSLPPDLDHIFYTAAAERSDEVAYRTAYLDGPKNLLAALRLQDQKPDRIFFTSSSAVYGQSGGEWVDENSRTEPKRFNGLLVLEGENLLRAGPFPTTVLRLGGIYGSGRDRLLRAVREGIVRCPAAPVYTNRIHRDDAAGALHHLMNLGSPSDIYVGVDAEPADLGEVYRWIADQLDLPPPPVSRGGPARESKRCSNMRLVQSGCRFLYPTYREGYRALIDGERHR